MLTSGPNALWLFFLMNGVLFSSVSAAAKIDGKNSKLVKLGERGVYFTCTRSRSYVKFKWCYDANCTRTVAQCPQNSCSKPGSICYCKTDSWTQKLLFPSINHTTTKVFYCHQYHPLKGNDPENATLQLRTDVTIRGRKVKKVDLNDKNVAFTCDGTSVSADLRWCYDRSCKFPVSACSQTSTNNSNVCYNKGREDTTLHFNTISENVTNKTYFCHQINPTLTKNSYQTVSLKVQKTGVILLGEKRKRVNVGENVTFECRSPDPETKVKWCYDANCTRTVGFCPDCSPNSPVCYCRLGEGDRVSKLVLTPITEKDMAKRYYCSQDKISNNATRAHKSVEILFPTTPVPTATSLAVTNASRSSTDTTSADITTKWSPSPVSNSNSSTNGRASPDPTSADIATKGSPSPVSNSNSSANGTASPDPTVSITPYNGDPTSPNTLLIAAIVVVCVIAVGIIIVLLLHRRGSIYRIRYITQSRDRPNLKHEKKWEIRRSQLKMGNSIGEGFFGSVIKAETMGNINGWTDTTVAVKMVHEKHCSDSSDVLSDEVEIMKKIGRHHNVIALIGVCLLNGPLWVVMEYAEDGDLLNYLRSLRSVGTLDSHILKSCATKDEERVLNEKTTWNFAVQIMSGMKHLISHKCVHRDLAARNVLVGKGLQLKICDFGMARDISYMEYYRRVSPGILPLKWTAPEAAVDKLYTEYSDVWSFGIVLWEIATLGVSPYPGVKTQCLIELLTAYSYRMSRPSVCPQSLYSLMTRCWNAVPEDRPSFTTMLKEREFARED